MPSIRKMDRDEIKSFTEKDDLGVNSALPPSATADDADDDMFIIGLTKFISMQKQLSTRRLRAKITAATQKAIMVEAHALVGESDTCNRCGKELTHPASRVIGYGSDCVWEVGIGALWERYADTLLTDPEAFRKIQIAAQRLSIVADWLPLSQISIRRDGSDETLRFPDDQDKIYALLRELGLLKAETPEDTEVELHFGQIGVERRRLRQCVRKGVEEPSQYPTCDQGSPSWIGIRRKPADVALSVERGRY